MNNISSDIDYTSIPTKTALLNSQLHWRCRQMAPNLFAPFPSWSLRQPQWHDVNNSNPNRNQWPSDLYIESPNVTLVQDFPAIFLTSHDDGTLLGKVTNVAKEMTSRIWRHVVMHVIFSIATQCLCCCYVRVLSLTCGCRHIILVVAMQCLCCCYVVYRSHVGAAILF